MNTTLGKRIAELRHKKDLKQDEIAEKLGVSPQAVSKWENDQTCPDISLLPQLAEILNVSVDELLSGKKEYLPLVKILPESERKSIKDRMLRIVVNSAGGDFVRVNLPLALLEIAIDSGLDMLGVTGNDTLKNIDLAKILELVKQGAIGNLVEVESAGGDTVQIFVE
jgi:transcriptional regulator with XRE-family HTH domain